MSRVWRKPGPADDRPRLTRRGLLLGGGMAGVMGVLGWRMRELQVLEADQYRLLAEENRINIRLIPPARGRIFDRAGRPLAVNRKNYRVVLIREQAGDVEAALDRLAELIPISDRERERAIRDATRKAAFVPVTVAEHLSWEHFARVAANAPALPGVDVEAGLTRYYPEGDALARHGRRRGDAAAADPGLPHRQDRGGDPARGHAARLGRPQPHRGERPARNSRSTSPTSS